MNHSTHPFRIRYSLSFLSIAFLILSLVFLLTGCGENSQKNDTKIKIGFAGVMTGPEGGELGTGFYNGSRLAVEEWNAKGGVLGKPIEVIERDDEGKPAQAIAVANDLSTRDIVGLIGHLNSGCTIPASPIYEEAGIVQITPSTNPEVTDRGLKTIFRLNGRDDQQGGMDAEFAYQKLGLRKMAVLHNKTAGGQGQAEEFKKRFEALGGEIVLFAGIGSEELDFRANITSIQSAGAEGLFFGGVYSQAGVLLAQMRQAELVIPFISGDGSFDSSLTTAAGPDVKDVYISFGPDYQNMPSTQTFLKKYRERFGPEQGYSIYGYESVNVLLSAIEKAGSTDSKKIIDALRSTRFETSMGPIEFDSKGDLKQSNFIIWTIKEGKFVPYIE